MDFSDYKTQAIENVKKTSRTVNGIVDVSASDTKVDAMEITDGEIAKDLALSNYLKAIEYVYENRFISFDSCEDLKGFVLTVGRIVNKGILKDGFLIRKEGNVDPLYHYEDAEDLDAAFDLVMSRFLEMEQEDPLYQAAFMEYYINMKLHLFADGCGKCSKVLAAFVLMKHDLPLPVYRGNKEYYQYAPSFKGKYFSKEDNEEFFAFREYYRTLN